MPRPNYYKRGTILIESGPPHDPERLHLHIICTNPDEWGDQLLVSVCSVDEWTHDTTCLLNRSDNHPFVKRPSYVAYRFARVKEQLELREGVRDKRMIPKTDMSNAAFLKICKGILASQETPAYLKEYYLENRERGESRAALAPGLPVSPSPSPFISREL